ncbi:MAG: helix-turn-helix transcriptional regulator [Oscillospiraceae bacterium]|nr:helix-turn-helix transcriptional regulator [Oscillospiraceae bacterium]
MIREMVSTDKPEKIAALLRRLPSAFPDMLKELMKWRGVTVEGLAGLSLLSAKTVQRLRRDMDYEPSMETVIALCVGLHLPPIICAELISKAGYIFRPILKHVAYQDLLARSYYEGFSVYEVNDGLKAQGIPQLGIE